MIQSPRRGGKRALILATRDTIRSGLGYGDSECDVTFDGHPPPLAGKVFVAVHRGGRNNQGIQNSLDMVYALFVTVSLRINEPYDRLGTSLLADAAAGMDDKVDDVIDLLHMNYDVTGAANTILLAEATHDVYGFSEPLAVEGDATYRMVGGEWFHGDLDAQEVGVVAEIRLGRARRLESIESLRS